MKKLITMLTLIVLVTALSCSDTELVSPVKKDAATVAPPPAARTVYLDARMSSGTLTPVDIYYMTPYPSGTWTYLATLTGTNCQNMGSFTAYDGDVVYVMVWDGTYNVSYHARAGTCASTSHTRYCGNQAYASEMYSAAVNGNNISIGMHVLVNNLTGEPLICVD